MDHACALPDVRRRPYRLGIAALLMTTPLALPIWARGGANPDAVTAMERYLARPTIARPYSASRRLEASGGGQRGWLDVRTEFTPASGLAYEVTSEGGSGYIRGRVLRSLLDEEQKLIARGGSAGVAISPDNYQFTPQRITEEGLAIVAIRPRRKDRSLIAGRMFLTMDGDLARVEGRLARNPSFWVIRVGVVRSYRRINGVLMPVSLDTTAQLRLLGSSALRMTYRYSRVDDRAVDEVTDGMLVFDSWRRPLPGSWDPRPGRGAPQPSP